MLLHISIWKLFISIKKITREHIFPLLTMLENISKYRKWKQKHKQAVIYINIINTSFLHSTFCHSISNCFTNKITATVDSFLAWFCWHIHRHCKHNQDLKISLPWCKGITNVSINICPEFLATQISSLFYRAHIMSSKP